MLADALYWREPVLGSSEIAVANTLEVADEVFDASEQLRLTSFEIDGLLGGDRVLIEFPRSSENLSEASILILQGRNGTGKTTILSMIGGMLRLEFDTFRSVPFQSAKLKLSNDKILSVAWRDGLHYPLLVGFDSLAIELAQDRARSDYSPSHQMGIEAFRQAVLPVLGGIHYELLGVERSQLPKEPRVPDDVMRRHLEREAEKESLSSRVRKFIREAQLNHRRYFRSEELSVLPNLLARLNSSAEPVSQDELLSRVDSIQVRLPLMQRYGLHTEDNELTVIRRVLTSNGRLSAEQRSLVEPYVEMQEALQKSRDLVARRLIEFEAIMDDFMVGKEVRVDSKNGLRIIAKTGPIAERSLSSGEYHFLYMMVSALLCQRVGSIIAIDEPELSLHVRWQRKLLNALSRCASGASPLFICATHSLSISAEHADRVQVLSPVD